MIGTSHFQLRPKSRHSDYHFSNRKPDTHSGVSSRPKRVRLPTSGFRHVFGEAAWLADDNLRCGEIGDRGLHFGVEVRLDGAGINLDDKREARLGQAVL